MGKRFLSLIIILMALSIISCGSSDSEKITPSEVALHEHAFKDDSSLNAQFNQVTVLEFEHALESNVHEKDSGTPGVDVIPFKVKEAKNHNFQFEDMGNGNHYAILRNENEEEVARIEANGIPVTVWLEPGYYKLYLHNMGTETFPLFLQPLTVDVGSNRQASYNWFQYIWVRIGLDCQSCDLSHSNLTGANLTDANLYEAWFLDAIWIDGHTCGQPSVGRCD